MQNSALNKLKSKHTNDGQFGGLVGLPQRPREL